MSTRHTLGILALLGSFLLAAAAPAYAAPRTGQWAGLTQESNPHPVDFSVIDDGRSVGYFHFRVVFRPPHCYSSWDWVVDGDKKIRNREFRYHRTVTGDSLTIFGRFTSRIRAEGWVRESQCDTKLKWTAFRIPPHQ